VTQAIFFILAYCMIPTFIWAQPSGQDFFQPPSPGADRITDGVLLGLLKNTQSNEHNGLEVLLQSVVDEHMSLKDINRLTILTAIATHRVYQDQPMLDSCAPILACYTLYAIIFHEPEYPQETKDKLLSAIKREPWRNQHELANSTLVDQITDNLLPDLIMAIYKGDHLTITELVDQLMKSPLTSNDIHWLLNFAEIAQSWHQDRIFTILTEAVPRLQDQQASSS